MAGGGGWLVLAAMVAWRGVESGRAVTVWLGGKPALAPVRQPGASTAAVLDDVGTRTAAPRPASPLIRAS